MSSVLALVLACCAAPLPAQAQLIEDPGPHLVGWRPVSFTDQIFGQGNISGRIYYPATVAGLNAPADPAGGPYPVVGFQHGWLGSPDDYDDLCSHVASWGLVVASTGTETGLFPNEAQFARDTRSLLHWVEAESNNGASWLAGMARPGDWAVCGHSMGGGVLSLLVGIEPRVATIIGLQSAALSGATAEQNMRAFPGAAYQIAGSDDQIVRSATVHDWYEIMDSARRNVFYEVQGMGHVGCTDNPTAAGLSGAEQHRLHRRLVTGLLRVEMLGEEELYVDLLGSGIAVEPVRYESDCTDPPFWAGAGLQLGTLLSGIAGRGGQRARLAGAPATGLVTTPYGDLGLDPASLVVFHDQILPGFGATEKGFPVQAGWSGLTLYFQGLVTNVAGGSFSRVAAVVIP